MKNMKVRAKLLTGFAIIAAIGMVLGLAGIFALQMTKDYSVEISSLAATSNGASNVLNAHYTWRHGLTEAVLTGGEFTGSLDPDSCALGKWLGSAEAKSISDPEILDLLRQIESPHYFIHTKAGGIIGQVNAGELEAAKADLVEVILPRTQEVISLLMKVEERFEGIIADKNQQILDLENIATYGLLGLILAAAILSIFMAIYMSNMISKPIVSLTKFLDKAGSKGDLSFSKEEKEAIGVFSERKDELGQLTNSTMRFFDEIIGVSEALAAISNGDITLETNVLSDEDTIGLSLKNMLEKLNHMFGEINASTRQVSSGSKQVADGAQSLAQGSTEQAAAIEELSSSIAEIAERIKINAETADKTAKLSSSIKESAEKGNLQMDEMISSVGEINEASKNISKIIKTIDDIAFQTNILALNAAVEAARAGQHGKGFAVVAEEVRNLASKSAEAAKDTGYMIQNSMEKAELGSRIAGETAASLNEIVTGINESSQLIAEIAIASEQQSLGIEQINIGIDQVTQVVQQNSATAQESAAASEEMSGQSDMLQQLIAQFKLKDSVVIYQRLPASGQSAPNQLALPESSEYALAGRSDSYGKY
ncbi:MAG: methyl-accepting chemotaxis protein [Clostridiales bacterium]|nr:methyl-accepting chemotaxis protein [Clostridiales bacterium]